MNDAAPTKRYFVSATQISTYRECKRKLAWRYVAKIETPETPQQALGNEVEKEQINPYLLSGRPFDDNHAGRIASSALVYLPKPKTPGLIIQQKFELPTPSWKTHQFTYLGYKDVWVPDNRLLPAEALDPAQGAADGTPTVVDFKTTGDLKWAKSKKTLATDIQAQLYATDAMYQTGSRTIDLVWMYMATKDERKAKRVHLRVVADQVAEQFAAINEAGREVLELRQAGDAAPDAKSFVKSLEPNPSACRDYGGCPYEKNCNLSPDEIIQARAAQERGAEVKEVTMGPNADLLAKLKARKAATNGTAPPVPDVAPLGINPPEAALPPAPPVGMPEPTPVAEVEGLIGASTKKRGRPTKVTPVPDISALPGFPVAEFKTFLSAWLKALEG